MTIITLKALSKISTTLVTSAMLTFPTVKASHAELTFDGGHNLAVCVVDGGDIVNNGKTRTCTNPVTQEVTECDNSAVGEDDSCSTEPVKKGHPTGGRLTKPVLKPGTMIMPPDTNTTIGTPAKPIARGSIMQKLIRN